MHGSSGESSCFSGDYLKKDPNHAVMKILCPTLSILHRCTLSELKKKPNASKITSHAFTDCKPRNAVFGFYWPGQQRTSMMNTPRPRLILYVTDNNTEFVFSWKKIVLGSRRSWRRGSQFQGRMKIRMYSNKRSNAALHPPKESC